MCLGSEKLVFPPCKNKLNMKTSDSIHALFISTACERNGEKKNLYLSNKHLPWLDEEQTLPLLMSVTR